jgi:DNA-binding CsgD family transcriptional regulator
MAAPLPRDVWVDRVDEAVRHRLADALTEARALLGMPDAPVDHEALTATAQALASRLAADVPEAMELRETRERQLAGIRARFEDRLNALGQVHEAVLRLRAVTSPSAMLGAAARALCESSAFERVLVSQVRDGTMIVSTGWFRDEEARAAGVVSALRDDPIPLEHPLIEAEILRRRRATVVAGAQMNQRVYGTLAHLMGWGSYVAAPVGVRSRVIALIHADRGPGRPVDVLDRDVLWEFASGLAQAHESASLRQRLRDERAHMRQFLERLNTRSAQLNDTGVELQPQEPIAGTDPPDPAPPQSRRHALLAGALTRRELEVLGLLSEGLSNRAIADELVVSEGTVKFHVNGVLRKLHVGNRAEAVARYLSLGGRISSR